MGQAAFASASVVGASIAVAIAVSHRLRSVVKRDVVVVARCVWVGVVVVRVVGLMLVAGVRTACPECSSSPSRLRPPRVDGAMEAQKKLKD
jgi:hypothetical protein